MIGKEVALDSFGLTLKQRLFCEHYLINGYNGTKAAREAGYSKDTATSIASENLGKPYIKRYIERRVKEKADKLGLTTEYLLSKIKQGIDLSIPKESEVDSVMNAEGLSLKEKMELLDRVKDIRAGVACISEANKMLGNYAPEKKEVELNAVEGLVEKYEKEF